MNEPIKDHGLVKHGHCRRKDGKNAPSVEYQAWRSMHKRCYVRVDSRKWYAGIEVCPRWHHDNPAGFQNFLADMGHKPEWAHSLDRIDGTLGYMPSNCRWATAAVQSANQRNRRIAADYTTRAAYQREYRERNREAINAKRRAWRKQSKLNATP